MKMKIALVLMLAAAGCAKKAGSECDAPINKGMDNLTQTLKARGSDSPMMGAMMGVIDKMRTTFLQRCHEDKWAPEAATCFGTVSSQPEVKACEGKLTEEQRTKLMNQVREIMMSSMRNMPGMPPGAGHPSMLQGSAAPAGSDSAAAAPAGGSAATAAGAAAPAAGAAPAGGSAAAAPAAAAGGDKPAGDKPAGDKPAGGGW